MKMDRKYQIRRLVAAIVLLAIFMTFTVSVLVKGIDNEIARRERVLTEHAEVWEWWEIN